MPDLAKYVFTFLSGHEAAYNLAQCERCHTIYWQETDIAGLRE